MHFLVAFALMSLFVGVVVTYVQPYVVAALPTSLTSSTTIPYLNVFLIGAVTLISLMIAVMIMRALKLKTIV